MKRIYAAFERVENVKAAVGRAKKESWNRADFMLIFPEKPPVQEDRFEFGNEHFLDSPVFPDISQWPALQEREIEGIGKVKTAISFKPDRGFELRDGSTLNLNYKLITDDLKKNKITAIIDADDEIVSKIETILESEGAEIRIFDAKRQDLSG